MRCTVEQEGHLELREGLDERESKKSRHIPSEKLSAPFAMVNRVKSLSMGVCRYELAVWDKDKERVGRGKKNCKMTRQRKGNLHAATVAN